MPVQVFPSSHGARTINHHFVEDSMDVLMSAWPDSRFHKLLHSSFDQNLPPNMFSTSNGFVYSIIEAYGKHHHLRVRPEDIWFAILTQLSLYINKNAEQLRNQFVHHQGQKALRLEYDPFHRHDFDFDVFARDMSYLLEKEVKDPELREWMMPNFTTTIPEDHVVASIIMMASLQKYFTYEAGIICGFPSVTLLGEKQDYEQILAKLDKLVSFGDEPTHFSTLLKPVIKRFIQTFEDPKAQDVINFWQRAMYFDDSICGIELYSGWITAFCCWNEDGDLTHVIDENGHSRRYPSPSAEYSDSAKFGDYHEEVEEDGGSTYRQHVRRPLYLSLDGVIYPEVDSNAIPPGFARVPVKIEDNEGKVDTEMVAGSVGISCLRSDTTGDLDVMQPRTGWWVYAKYPDEHPDLAAFRQRAKARGLSELMINETIAEAHSTGFVPDDSTVDVLVQLMR